MTTPAPITCIATKQYDATSMSALKRHATQDASYPLCTRTLNVLTYDPGVTATADNVDCKRCLKKLDTSPKETSQ